MNADKQVGFFLMNVRLQEKVGTYQEYRFCRYSNQRMNLRRVEKIPYGEQY